MSMIGVDYRVVDRVSRILSKKGFGELPVLDVFDERYYPGRGVERELVLRYFIVMVAMDHRLSRPGRPYEGYVDGEFYHGADLLYRLGKKMFDEDPGFYSPENLSRIGVDDVKRWLSIDGVEPPDLVVRVYLLRDLGYKLVKLYSGSVSNLLDKAGDRLRGSIVEPGLNDLLKVFHAYSDPVEKKSMLLAKFLIARGLFNPVDRLDLAIDNHLTRIAIRLGLVMISGDLWRKIREGVEASYDEDLLIRLVVRKAYHMVVEKTGIDPRVLDDYLWIMGRETCLRDKPLCEKCLFKNICLAYRNNVFMVNEHRYYNTWFY